MVNSASGPKCEWPKAIPDWASNENQLPSRERRFGTTAELQMGSAVATSLTGLAR